MYDAGVVGPLEIVVAFSDGAALHEWDDESHDQARPGQCVASSRRRLICRPRGGLACLPGTTVDVTMEDLSMPDSRV